MKEAETNNYYVYMYIDPRNYEEFYYGKGRGTRKNSHLFDDADTAKTKRIAEIRKEGLEPIIRVIARALSESEALLVEKTLLWKLGKWTTNISSGHFADKFRPHNMLHKEVPGFDFQNNIYFYNVGECARRNWDDYIKFGFISAGGRKKLWRKAICAFKKGDVFVAYLAKHGFVGIGKVESEAKLVRDVCINRNPLLSLPLKAKNMAENFDDEEKSEHVCLVNWIKTFPRHEAKWRPKYGLYTPELIRASLQHSKTINFIETEFGIKLNDLIR